MVQPLLCGPVSSQTPLPDTQNQSVPTDQDARSGPPLLPAAQSGDRNSFFFILLFYYILSIFVNEFFRNINRGQEPHNTRRKRLKPGVHRQRTRRHRQRQHYGATRPKGSWPTFSATDVVFINNPLSTGSVNEFSPDYTSLTGKTCYQEKDTTTQTTRDVTFVAWPAAHLMIPYCIFISSIRCTD